MKVYCPTCHKRYGQAKLKKNEKVGLKCECGTWFEVEKLKITYIPLDDVEHELSYNTLHKEVENRLDLEILRSSLSAEDNELLDLMLEGKTQRDIAIIKKVSQKTISKQFKNIQKIANK
jgi:DNA-binding CsgD family transcriptional regulator